MEAGNCRVEGTPQRVIFRMRGMFRCSGGRLLRLNSQERRHHSDQNEQGHREIACGPSSVLRQAESQKPGHQKECARPGDERTYAICRHVGSHARRLLFLG